MMGHPFRVLFHVLVCLARAVGAMHQAGPGSDNYVRLLPKKRFMAQAADLFLTNELSAVKFSSLVENARLAGAQTGRIKQGSKKNLARDLRRSVLKTKKWPKPYFVNIPCEDPKTNQTVTMCVPLWLPHEICYVFQQECGKGWLDRSGLSPQLLGHVSDVERREGLPVGELVALALWSDGVPFSNNRLKSIEVGALSFPGLQDDLRIPLWVLPKDFIVTNLTMKCVFQVIKWSFEQLICGVMPNRRHDGGQWLATDSTRARWSGQLLQRAVLVQVRGDWACYKYHFNLAGSQARVSSRRRALRASFFLSSILDPGLSTQLLVA